jgi:hypothetical protein
MEDFWEKWETPKKMSKKKRREQLLRSKEKGKAGEEDTEWRNICMGREYERKPKGQDYISWRKNPRTGKRQDIQYEESKTGNSQLSRLQKKTRKKVGRKYHVRREHPMFYPHN